MSDHEDETINKENAPPKVVPQIITVTNISTKFLYLKKGEYDIWAIKMQNFISSSDLLCWNIILKGNSAKSMTTDNDGGLEYISFDDLYNKLKFLEIDTKGYLSSSSTLSNAAFVNQHLVYKDLDQMNKEDFKEYDLKHQMAMLSIKLVKCLNCKQMGHFSRECRAQEPRSLENFGMVAGLEIASDADSEGEVVFDNDAIPVGVSVFVGDVAAAVAAHEKQDLMTKLDNELANQAKWNNSGKNLYKLIDSSMSVRTKRGLRLDKYIREGKLGIDDSKFSIFHTNSDELEGQPIYNRFASVDHMKAVPPPLTGNYMPPSNIPDIDESQMVYGKKATDSSEIKTNDDSISHSHDSECSRPNNSDHDSNDSISSVSASASESRDTIVIDCARQEDFPSVCTSSIETDVKYSKTLCNKFGSFNKESHFRKHKSVASKYFYVCGSYLHIIKDCDLHEQRLVKKNAKGKGKLGRRPTGKPVNLNRANLVSAGKATLACNSIPLSIFAGNGILGTRPLNIQPKSTYFHSFTHNNQQIIFLITHNSLYSLYMTDGLNGKTAVKPSAGWHWTKYSMSKTTGSKINGGSKSKS
nr:ribonuclease H-like domain, Gag-pre-integrase domain protein [Tanacetum cinerariifolium]